MTDANSIIVLVYFAISSILLAAAYFKLSQLKKNIAQINAITKQSDLNTYLADIAAENKNILEQQVQIQKAYTELRGIAQKSLQKTSLVRFNPFKDTGGDQSFVLCLLDHTDTGVLVTAIHSRDGTRVYTKEIMNGTCKLSLSHEEKQSLAKAMRSS